MFEVLCQICVKQILHFAGFKVQRSCSLVFKPLCWLFCLRCKFCVYIVKPFSKIVVCILERKILLFYSVSSPVYFLFLIRLLLLDSLPSWFILMLRFGIFQANFKVNLYRKKSVELVNSEFCGFYPKIDTSVARSKLVDMWFLKFEATFRYPIITYFSKPVLQEQFSLNK